MAYDVTKRIKGRDYIYRVEGYRDPKTGQQKKLWRYVGRLANGEVQPALRTRSERVTREKIIEATARLMEHRDPKHITISVIASQAKISPSTFYRHFPDRDSVVNAAVARITNEVLEAALQLDIPPRSLNEARQRLRQCHEELLGSALKQRALRWSRCQTEQSLLNIDYIALLARFFKKIHYAGFASIEDPETLARAIKDTQGAFYIAMVAELNEIDVARPPFPDLFSLIERAVFGARAS
jgi:AcrR family transcriptional regulator